MKGKSVACTFFFFFSTIITHNVEFNEPEHYTKNMTQTNTPIYDPKNLYLPLSIQVLLGWGRDWLAQCQDNVTEWDIMS